MSHPGEPPDDLDADDRSRIRVAAWERIEHLIAVGQLERAREFAAESISQDPDDTSALLGMARVQMALEDWESALVTLEAVLAQAPDADQAHHLRALVALALGRFRLAEEAIREAITLDPDWAGYRTSYARILSACHVFPAALAQATLALEIDPEDADAHAVRSTLLLTVPRADLSLSEESARRAVALDPDDANAHAALGFAHLKAGKIDEAVARCRSALEIDPQNGLALRALVEATAASTILYRPMFGFSSWLERLGQGGTFAFIFGLWAVVNAVTGYLRDSPYAEYATPLTTGYLVFCAYTWFSRPITMFLLKLKHPWLRNVDV